MAWDDARINRLKVLWADGKSASQIANLLGEVTRNAVIGKIHRLGLAGRKSSPRRPALYRPTKQDSTLLYTIPKPPKPWQINCAAKPTVAKYAPGPAGGVLFADLENGMCKYPLGDRLDKAERFCGATVAKGSATGATHLPYCACHAEICYSKWQPTGNVNNYKFSGEKKAA